MWSLTVLLIVNETSISLKRNQYSLKLHIILTWSPSFVLYSKMKENTSVRKSSKTRTFSNFDTVLILYASRNRKNVSRQFVSQFVTYRGSRKSGVRSFLRFSSLTLLIFIASLVKSIR